MFEKHRAHTYYRALLENHTMISMSGIGPYSEVMPRSMRALMLFICLVFDMVAVALIYEFLYPVHCTLLAKHTPFLLFLKLLLCLCSVCPNHRISAAKTTCTKTIAMP